MSALRKPHAGDVVTREEPLARVRSHQDGGSRLLDVRVRRLRTGLERDPSAPEPLVTVRGLGDRLDG